MSGFAGLKVPIAVSEPPDDRFGIGQALSLASAVTTIALTMVIPALLGHWLDRWLGVSPLFAAAGAALGLYAGIRGLLELVRPKDGPKDSDRRDGPGE